MSVFSDAHAAVTRAQHGIEAACSPVGLAIRVRGTGFAEAIHNPGPISAIVGPGTGFDRVSGGLLLPALLRQVQATAGNRAVSQLIAQGTANRTHLLTRSLSR